MVRHVRLGEFLVGVSGMALMRRMFAGTDEDARRRLEEIRAILESDDETYNLGVDVPVLEAVEGYDRWAETYDHPGNPLISIEQPVVWSILEGLAPGDALDVACGTGRHAGRLAQLGHRVVGVDGSTAMLARARAAVPEVEFIEGSLTALPVPDASADVVVCALALEHVSDLEAAVLELSRVARRPGSVVVSGLHPVLSLIGGEAYFQDASGVAGIVRGNCHLHSDYLHAFAAAGLEVRQCIEPCFGVAEAGMQGPASSFLPDTAETAYVGLPGALVWDLAASTP